MANLRVKGRSQASADRGKLSTRNDVEGVISDNERYRRACRDAANNETRSIGSVMMPEETAPVLFMDC